MSNLTRNIAAAIAVQVAAVIGKRRANRARQNRARVTVAGFNIPDNAWLIRASLGHHGPDAQYAAARELDAMRRYELHTKEAS